MTLEVVSEIIGTNIGGREADLALKHWLADRRSGLPARISTGGSDPDAMLCSFLSSYIRILPGILTCLSRVSCQPLAVTVADECILYFTALPGHLTGRNGINGLLTGAYRSHRLLEEFRDQFPELGRSKLAEFVNGEANLLVHALIGEPFSNEIDQACEQDFARLFLQLAAAPPFDSGAFISQMAGCSALANGRLKSLLEDHQINLGFGYQAQSGSRFGSL